MTYIVGRVGKSQIDHVHVSSKCLLAQNSLKQDQNSLTCKMFVIEKAPRHMLQEKI